LEQLFGEMEDSDGRGKTVSGGGRVLGFRLREISEVFLIAAVLALSLRVCVIDAVHVPSQSMENTILPGDFLLVNKLEYGAVTPRALPFLRVRLPAWRVPGIGSPRRGDVIEFYPPNDLDGTRHGIRRAYVKRVVGVPGDIVEIRKGFVFVNNEPLTPPLLAEGGWRAQQDFAAVRVPRKGDRISLADDSADRWEPIIRCDGHTVAYSSQGKLLIDGKPSSTYEVSQDYYFALGDNITESSDSREWGFIPYDHIVGKVSLVYWSNDPRDGIRWSRVGTIVR
jgi:signal peptidase I